MASPIERRQIVAGRHLGHTVDADDPDLAAVAHPTLAAHAAEDQRVGAQTVRRQMQEVRPIVRGIEVESDPGRVVQRGTSRPETARLVEMLGQAPLAERERELRSPSRQAQQQRVRALAATIGTEHDRLRPGHQAADVVGDDQRQIGKE